MIITNRSLLLVCFLMFLSLVNIYFSFDDVFLLFCFFCFLVLLVDYLFFVFVKIKITSNNVLNVLYLNNEITYYLNINSLHKISYNMEMIFQFNKDLKIDNSNINLKIKKKYYRISNKLILNQVGIINLPILEYRYFSPLMLWKKSSFFYSDQTIQVLPFRKDNLFLKKLLLPEIFILSCTDEMPNKFYAPVYKAISLILENYIVSKQFVGFLQVSNNWNVYFKPTNKVEDIKQINHCFMQQSLNKNSNSFQKYFINLKCDFIILLVDNLINRSLLFSLLKSKKKIIAICFIDKNLNKAEDEITALLNLQHMNYIANLQKQSINIPKSFRTVCLNNNDSVSTIYNKIIESMKK